MRVANLLILFGLLLGGLISFQWFRETELRKNVRLLTEPLGERVLDITNLQARLKADESEIQHLEGLKNQLSRQANSNALEITAFNKKLQQALDDLERSQSQIAAYRDALQKANENILKQNEDIKRQNEDMRKLAEDRNETVKKFNKMAADYSDLATRWNTQQETLRKAGTNAAAEK
jgi:chromosome segregation ATPase